LANRACQWNVCGLRIERGLGPKTEAHFPPERQWVACQNLRAGLVSQKRQEQTDGPLADNKYNFIPSNACLLYGLQAGVHRLDEGGFFKCHAIRDADHSPPHDMRHDPYILRKASTVGFKSGSHAHLLVLRALRK
jgi:hypothetical protein